MRFAKGLVVVCMVGAIAGCRPEEEENELRSLAIVCSAELLDSAGAPVLSLQDTMNIEVSDDSVAADPRPCRTSYHRGTKTLMVNAKEARDTATGDPRD